MIAESPLRRAAEQPPCDARSESLCLNGMFAVPERMAHYDLGPHLFFSEHQAIWHAMVRVVDGEPDGFWWRTFQQLRCDRSWHDVDRLLAVLNWLPFLSVGNSDKGCMVFMLALSSLERCTLARCEYSEIQARATELWRIPNTPYSQAERLRLLGDNQDVGFELL